MILKSREGLWFEIKERTMYIFEDTYNLTLLRVMNLQEFALWGFKYDSQTILTLFLSRESHSFHTYDREET